MKSPLGRLVRLGVLTLVLLAAAFLVLEQTLRPSVEATIQHLVQIRATESISRAVLDRTARVRYEDLYDIQKNDQGLVAFLQPNTTEINRLAAQMTLAVQRELKGMERQEFGVTMGQVVGSRLFATRGPALQVGLQSLGTVRATVVSRFEQAGLNQTRHLVYLKVRTDIQAVAPTFTQVYPIEEQIPLAEGIIVGPVPQGGILDFRMGPGAASPAPSAAPR